MRVCVLGVRPIGRSSSVYDLKVLPARLAGVADYNRLPQPSLLQVLNTDICIRMEPLQKMEGTYKQMVLELKVGLGFFQDT